MAKNNLLLGLAKGKLGDLVLYRRNGAQVTRTRVTPANPKSEAQSRQRMAFATIASSASRLKKIIDHSYEGVKYGQDSINYFMSKNMGMVRAGAQWDGVNGQSVGGYLIKGAKTIAPMPFCVSQGSLSIPAYVMDNLGGVKWADPGSYEVALRAPLTTLDAYKAALAALGCAPGDQLTLVVLASPSAAPVAAEYTPTGAYNDTIYAEYARLVFVSEADYVPSSLPLVVESDGSINPDYVVSSISADWIDNVRVALGEHVAIRANLGAGMSYRGAALIRSNYVGDKWQRSTSYLAIEDVADDTADMVWQSYAAQSDQPTSDMYLNQGLGERNLMPSRTISPLVLVSVTRIANNEANAIFAGRPSLMVDGSWPTLTLVRDGSGEVLDAEGGTDGRYTFQLEAEWVEDLPNSYTIRIDGQYGEIAWQGEIQSPAA